MLDGLVDFPYSYAAIQGLEASDLGQTSPSAWSRYGRALLLGFIGPDDGMEMYRRLGSVSGPSDLLENELSIISIQHNGSTIDMEQIFVWPGA